jgi:hypothetical protein
MYIYRVLTSDFVSHHLPRFLNENLPFNGNFAGVRRPRSSELGRWGGANIHILDAPIVSGRVSFLVCSYYLRIYHYHHGQHTKTFIIQIHLRQTQCWTLPMHMVINHPDSISRLPLMRLCIYCTLFIVEKIVNDHRSRGMSVADVESRGERVHCGSLWLKVWTSRTDPGLKRSSAHQSPERSRRRRIGRIQSTSKSGSAKDLDNGFKLVALGSHHCYPFDHPCSFRNPNTCF